MKRQKKKILPMSPNDELLYQQFITGTNLIKLYGKKATDVTTNDKKLSAMTVALVMAIKDARRKKDRDGMSQAIALAMIAAYEYGKAG